MTIRAGVEWGATGPLGSDQPVFDRDAAAREHLQARYEATDGTTTDGPLAEIGLVGGDLHRTLGSPRHRPEELHEGRGMRFPVDLGVAELDGRELVFLSHLVAHPSRRIRWWSRRTVVVMNASFVGELDLGPRAHPNDGRLDVTDGALPAGQRRQGRRRARTGTHLPHPSLSTRSVRTTQIRSGDPLHVWLDGTHVGVATEVSVRCLPDAAVVVA